jgi:tripartite-type tricarboxylate transporter receptor subunit TctC
MKRIAATLSTLITIGFVAAIATSDTAGAQTYPNRPIRLVVPFPAGGPLDVMGRLLAQQLSISLGQVIVDNRPGAGATLGGRAVATAEPDGYTLLLGSAASLAIGPALYKNIGYDPLRSFAPVGMFSSVPYVMVAAMNAPYTSVPELLAYAKANPGTLNFGVPNGAPPHMLAEMFKMESKADVVVVPYKGAATVITDLIGGQIHGGFETTSVMFGHLHDGKVRGLAVVREQRLPELPNVPTMIESGLPGVVGASWSGLLAPAGTPQDIVDKLRAAVVAMLESDEIKDKFKKLGADGKSSSPQDFAAFIAAEHGRIGAIVRASGAKSE